MNATIIHQGRVSTVAPAEATPDALWLPLPDLAATTGWELKPEGVCRDTACIPLPDDRRAEFLHGEGNAALFNLAAFARLIEQPSASDDAATTWYFGDPAWEWRSRLSSRAAPDFALPDFAGKPHRLSDYRGKKVFLLCWASWCGCRLDLPTWSDLREELKNHGFEVITVACESEGQAAAQPFIDAAMPQHPSLLDVHHLVPELYNTRNVPAAFWIDEEGRIVRANDPIYAQRRSQQTGESTTNVRYLDAVRDWVANGPKAEYVQNSAELGEGIGEQTWEDVQAMAQFRLGVYLYENGGAEEAIARFKQAHALRPENWNYKRQAWNLGDIKQDYGYELSSKPSGNPARPSSTARWSWSTPPKSSSAEPTLLRVRPRTTKSPASAGLFPTSGHPTLVGGRRKR